jgi:hypothetical protein
MMAKLVIEIELGNDACSTGNDVSDILRKFARDLRCYVSICEVAEDFVEAPLLDENGNKVGVAKVVK